MTNQKLQHDIDEAKAAYTQVSLNASEKVALKNLVLDAVRTSESDATSVAQSAPSVWVQWHWYARAIPIALLVFVLIGAPVVFAAERSLPGDTLYGVKVAVNEEVVAAFVPAPEKDEYYQTLLAKRASEVRVLAKRGELTEDRAEIVQEVLASNVTDALRASEASGEPEEDVLQDHQAIVVLVTMSEEIVDAAQDVAGVLATVEADTASLVEEGELASAEQSVYEKFDAIREEASTALSAHVSALATAEPTFVQDVVDELVDDARTRVAEVLRDVPQPDAVVPVLETVSVTIPVDVPTMVLEDEQRAVGTEDGIDAELLMITGEERVPGATVEQVLRVHERLARERSERAINALVNALEGEAVTANEQKEDTPAAAPEL